VTDQLDDQEVDWEALLIEDIAQYETDPLGYVRFAFPWGEKGGPLEHKRILDWQEKVLTDLGEGVLSIAEAIAEAERLEQEAEIEAYQDATSSGHGIGKSALTSWIVLWAMCTFEDTRGIVTAGTDTQLKTKTIAELSKWYRMCICKDWFILTASALYSAIPAHAKTWRMDFISWNESNPDAFAGLHNEGKRILVIMDEASQIPEAIVEVVKGALTDAMTQIIFMMFGNPTRTGTPFYDCWGRFSRRWKTRKIDSSTVEITNKTQINGWLEDYGFESDFYKVRVRGEFPSVGSMQFIPTDLVQEARKREVEALPSDPGIVMVDVARFGDDNSVIGFRRGRDAKSVPWKRYLNIDTMTLASEVAAYANENNAAAIMVDGTGIGAGVVDRLRQLKLPRGCRVYEVHFGGKANNAIKPDDETARFANHITEMAYHLRTWLKKGAIPDDDSLERQLTTREYGYDADNAFLLEKKQDVKKRLKMSPDDFDCLALSFHVPVRLEKPTRATPPPKTATPMARGRRR
jgi:hypothetical protein